MSSDLKFVLQSLYKLETTVSVCDDPELWLKENSEQVKSAFGNTSSRLRPLDLGHCLFPRIVAYIHVLSILSGTSSTINSLPIEDQSSIDKITRLSQYQTTQLSLKKFIQDHDAHPSSFKENWEKIQYLDNLSLLAHTIVVIKNHQDVRMFIEKGGGGIDAFLNLLQELLDAPYARLARPLILRTLLDLTKRYGVYPKSLILLDVVGNSSMLMASGGFGHIYQGIYRDSVVAIKAMRIISAKDRNKLMKSFIREAILWRQFDHPNVVPFYGIHIWTDQQDPRICLVSPWMEHKNMIEYMVANPHADILSLMLDVATGLEYLHKFDPTVIHGDLKGNNILIKSDSRAAVADFGLCRLIEDASIPFTPNSTSVTAAGAWKYMAPELLRPSTARAVRTTATDIYAFGCVCYEMFTGNPRFSNLTHYEGMMATVENRVVPRPEMCSVDLWVLIKACWEVDPSSRPEISGIVQDLTANLAKHRRSGSPDSWTSPSWTSLHSSTLYSQSMSSLPSGLTGDEGSQSSGIRFTTSEPKEISDNPTDPLLSGIRDGIVEGAEVRLQAQELKFLPGDQTKTLRSEDIIVALIGPSGTGKSSFVNAIMSKVVAKVGDDYESCTQQVRAYGCIHPDGSGRKVIIVDTPGFDDTYRFDFDVLRDLAKWLAKTYRKKITLSGILHFHSIEESRMRGSSIRSLQMFQALCGENALCNVVFTTTYWDRVSSEVGANRESQLQLEFWKLFIDQGSRVARFQPRSYETAWNLIDLFSTPLNSPNAAPKARQPLQIQTELVTEGKPLHQSSAYVFLLGWWTNLADRLKQALGSKTDRFKRAEKQKKRLEYRNNTPVSPALGSGFFGLGLN